MNSGEAKGKPVKYNNVKVEENPTGLLTKDLTRDKIENNVEMLGGC